MPSRSDYLQLHLIILLNSFVPKVFIEISIPSVEMVLIRTCIAVFLLGIFVFFKKYHLKVSRNDALRMLGTGLITAIYWILLSDASKSSNASVTLVGIATTSLWVSFFNLFLQKKFDIFQILSGLVATLGIYIIYKSKFDYDFGFSLAILSAVVGAVVTMLNARLARIHHHYVVTFYQMIGVGIAIGIFLPFYYLWHKTLTIIPTATDLMYIFALALVFSLYSYSVFIKIMKRISPFIVALTANLSPIYGIIFALLISQETEMMNFYFYVGTFVVLLSVFAYPLKEFLSNQKAQLNEEVEKSTEK